MYFGQFSNAEGDTISVLLGDKKAVDLAKVEDLAPRYDMTIQPLEVDTDPRCIDSVSFSTDHSLEGNAIHFSVPNPREDSYVGPYDVAISETTPSTGAPDDDTPPDPPLRINVVGYKKVVRANGTIDTVEVDIAADALSLVKQYDKLRNSHGQQIIVDGKAIWVWQLWLNGINMPNGNDYYQLRCEISYPGYYYGGKPVISAWDRTIWVRNTGYQLTSYYSIKASPGAVMIAPEKWESIVSTNPSVANITLGDKVELHFNNAGTAVLSYVNSADGSTGYCKVYVGDIDYTTLTFADDPVVIATQPEGGILAPYKGTSATIRVLTENPYFDLYSSDFDKVAKIYKQSAGEEAELLFYGFITPNAYSQEYRKLDVLEFECVDFLQKLKTIYASDIDYDSKFYDFNYFTSLCLIKYVEHYPDYLIPDYFYTETVQFNSEVAMLEDFTLFDVLLEFCKVFGLEITYYNDTLYFIDVAGMTDSSQIEYRRFSPIYDDYGSPVGYINKPTTTTLQKSFVIPNHGYDDASISIDESYKCISVKQNFTDNSNAIEWLGPNNYNITHDTFPHAPGWLPREEKSYSYFSAQHDTGKDNVKHKIWVEFFDGNEEDSKFRLKGTTYQIKYKPSTKTYDWGLAPNLVQQLSNDGVAYQGGYNNNLALSAEPYVEDTQGIPRRNSLFNLLPSTKDILDDRIPVVPNQIEVPINPRDVGSWTNNGLDGNCFIPEISMPVRLQEKTHKDYMFETPRGDGWEEYMMFTHFTVRGKLFRTSDLSSGRWNSTGYSAMQDITSTQYNLDITKYISVNGKIAGYVWWPNMTRITHPMRSHSDHSLNGLDCNLVWETSDGRYFAARQMQYYKKDEDPPFITTTKWYEISSQDWADLNIGTFASQTSYLYRIPVNLGKDDTNQQNGKFYDFSDNGNLYNPEAKGFTIQLPYYTDEDAPLLHHPWGDDEYDPAIIYSGKSNVEFDPSYPELPSKEGKLHLMALGSAYGGMFDEIGRSYYSLNYAFLSKIQMMGSPSALSYFELPPGESSLKDAATTFTYDITKHDYSKWDDVEMYFHSVNPYLPENSTNTLIVNGEPIISAPQYAIDLLGLNPKDSLEKALLQRYYNQYSKPRIELHQSYFDVDGFLPYTAAYNTGLFVDDEGDSKQLGLNYQERHLKPNRTTADWVELGTTEKLVVPANRRRKR